jgi:hypothetical protein
MELQCLDLRVNYIIGRGTRGLEGGESITRLLKIFQPLSSIGSIPGLSAGAELLDAPVTFEVEELLTPVSSTVYLLASKRRS